MLNLFRNRRRAPPLRARTIQLVTIPAVERRSISLSSSSGSGSSDEDTPAEEGEPSQPGSSSLPPLDDGLFPHILNPPKPNIDTQEYSCGICGDMIIVQEPPRFPSSYATSTESDPESSSAPKTTGLSLPCGMGHRYCFPCLSTFIKTKLADASVKSVFPIRCPECNYWIQDWTAKQVLTKEEMEGLWYWAKVFEEVPTFYCPIGTCGARVELPAQECSRDLRRADCPACKETFCYRCQVKWHEGQTCAKYARVSGAIHRDKALQKLAKKQKWRRCPKCRVVVERNLGCRHISCRCGYQFCYNCGRNWGDGCGRLRSKLCFPLAPEIWPETRGWVVETIRDLFRSGSR